MKKPGNFSFDNMGPLMTAVNITTELNYFSQNPFFFLSVLIFLDSFLMVKFNFIKQKVLIKIMKLKQFNINLLKV